MTFNDYDAFKEKFKPKKTTDDCYTPEPVYNAVLKYVTEKYDIGGQPICRPFRPGGDYEMFDYPDNCVVLDNPPFSIITQIARFYDDHDVKFWLFAPTLTNFSVASDRRICHVITDAEIVYHNGARVNTSFVTNLDDALVITAPDLARLIADAQIDTNKKKLPKYDYPDNLLTVNDLNKISGAGIEFRILDGYNVGYLDAQKGLGKTIFGSGLLISDKRAELKRAELKRAELKRAELKKSKYIFGLSEREKNIINDLNEREASE